MMKRHRLGAPQVADSSSDEEDDAFAALAQKSSAKRPKRAEQPPVVSGGTASSGSPAIRLVGSAPNTSVAESLAHSRPESVQEDSQVQLPASTTSSMKRHHGAISSSRKAKMDSMLEELSSTMDGKKSHAASSAGFAPTKKGSYVEAGEEQSTTNIFVGNLPTHVTELQLGDVFRQFGNLYSIKIMWPRPGDAARNRHTGFVCFLRRKDAEVALRNLDDTDPFASGRRITLRWGKNIIREASQQDAPSLPSQQQQLASAERPTIRVQAPADAVRERWIATVADFVARDGSAFENALLSRERGNPRFDFLVPGYPDHAYYKWRVYAFCQGDYYGTRNAPFSILEGGCLWVPPRPPTPPVASRVEAPDGTSSTGGRLRTDGHARLDEREIAQAHQLFSVELCASRQSICRAMAFCFEKTAAAHHVGSLLRDLFVLVDSTSGNTSSSRRSSVSVETLISRLYLVSDVLFNSQQPNVKHAFFYRSAVESMAPAVFSALGSFSRHQQSRGRRWTRHHKLATCVHVVLQAWSAWDVYPPAFLQELQALFDGREVDSGAKSEGDAIGLAYQQDSNSEVPEPDLAPMSLAPVPVIREGAQGNWTTVEETVQADTEPKNAAVSDESRQEAKAGDGEPLEKEGDRLGGGEDDDPDGEPLEEEDRDGESFEDEDPDGEPLDDGDDGEPIDGDEILEQLPRVAVLSEPED